MTSTDQYALAPRNAQAPPAGSTQRYAALRSISALILREMGTRFGRTPGGYVWIVLQPLGIIFMLAIAFSLLQRSPKLGDSFLLFKGTGFLMLNIFKNLSQTIGMSLPFSRPLLAYPGVTWIDTVLARMLLNTLLMLMVTVIILIFIVLYDGVRPVLTWGPLLMAVGLAILLGFGIGCLNCVLFMRFPVWQMIWGILTAPLVLISGVMFLYETLPPLAQQILWYNPLYHVTGLIRAGFFPIYKPSYISVTYVLACALIPMLLGLLVMRRFHRVLLER